MPPSDQDKRFSYQITGTVQGVGFRPFIYRLANDGQLSGWIRNDTSGVHIELQGSFSQLQQFEYRVTHETPPLARITDIARSELPPLNGETYFKILESQGDSPDLCAAPDSALCPDCLHELQDPSNRRYLHPFITCTNCGPRWTIITGTPYDRPLTTMAAFPLCPDCDAEYHDPANRRFHAQPISCHHCGPRLSLHADGCSHQVDATDILAHSAHLLVKGMTVAIKGVGGYHLAVDACSDHAVAQLRQRKHRDEKPFAVMVPDLATARQIADFSELEARLLTSSEAPITIVRQQENSPLSSLIAPGSRWIGLMLAYTPLHWLLIDQFCKQGGFPALVMTSGNNSDEPMLSDDHDALTKLQTIADAILTHDRPIHTRTDDSVIRVFSGDPLFYRRSRGYVPRMIPLPHATAEVLAVGAELKNTVCLTRHGQACISQHIGDLKNPATFDTFQQTIRQLMTLLGVTPRVIACDMHPDYLSSRFAEAYGCPVVKIQHHHAHMASCMAEHKLDGTLLGVVFDGTGFGPDGSIWGGEFLLGGYHSVQRIAHLKPVRLPGGDAAARDTWRMALAWLYPLLGAQLWNFPQMPDFTPDQKTLISAMIERGIQSPYTSSMGRLFDAAAFLAGAATCNNFDGQAAMALESLAESTDSTLQLTGFALNDEEETTLLDASPTLRQLAERRQSGADSAQLARGFHQVIAEAVCSVSLSTRRKHNINRIVLSGGVFQNRLLSSMVYTILTGHGFQVYSQRLAPPNDGGLCLGQAAIAVHQGG